MLFIGKLPEEYMKTIKNGSDGHGITLVGRNIEIMPEKIYENIYHIFAERLEMKTIISNRKNIEINDLKYADKSNEGQIIILILTDALRPDHMSLYGYQRNTTPYMQQYNFIPYNDMYACETVTARSVPCLLTSMERNSYYLSYFSKPSIFTMFKKAGFYTALISSQGSMGALSVGQSAMANDSDYSFLNNNNEVAYDFQLLPYFDETLNNSKKNKLIVLHINGSHWDYNTRFKTDDAKWQPLCNDFSTCSTDELINSYDNTILATDNFVKQVIERIKDKNAVIYFTSDHGQLLGEGGLRLHAQGRLNIKELGVVPFAVWLTDKAKSNMEYDTIVSNSKKISTHDAIFHSITSCAGLKSDIINEELSICSKNFKESPNEFKEYHSQPVK